MATTTTTTSPPSSITVALPQIATHVQEGRAGLNEPINSIDHHPVLSGLLVTGGGGENKVVLWRLDEQDNPDSNWVQCTLELVIWGANTSLVNAVRFSPDGKYLACACDDGSVVLLFPKPELVKSWLEINEEKDLARKTLRQSSDVLDLSWAPNSKWLATGSIDNTVVIWDVVKAAQVHKLTDHQNYAQGVAFSPDGRYFASQSSDQTVRVYRVIEKPNGKVVFEPSVTLKKPRLFKDDMTATFCRRLAFSANSVLLVTPTGQHFPVTMTPSVPPSDTTTSVVAVPPTGPKSAHATHVFYENTWKDGPFASLTGMLKASVAVRFHPREFELRPNMTTEPWAPVETIKGVPCRYVFAVATLDAVLVYDTQCSKVLAVMENLHLANLTDITWVCGSSSSIDYLVITSMDGYFSIVKFTELGKALPIEMTTVSVVAPSAPAQVISPSVDAAGSSLPVSATKRESPGLENMDSSSIVKRARASSPPLQQLDGATQPVWDDSISRSSMTSLGEKRRIAPTVIDVNVSKPPSPLSTSMTTTTITPIVAVRRITLSAATAVDVTSSTQQE